MQCQFVVDVDVDVSTMAESEKAKVNWRQRTTRTGRKQKLAAYFKAGTVYEHPDAAHFVRVGCAIPFDAECKAACADISPDQLARLAKNYQADAAGILDEDDRELFFAGVIKGYEKVGDKTAYIPGPNYEAWKQAKDEEEAAAEKDI